MSTSPDFKYLWNKQEVATPDMTELLKKTGHFRRRQLGKLILTNVLLTATALFIGYIWYNYQPQMISTKTGMALVILAMFCFLVVYNGWLPLLKKIEHTSTTQVYLQQLLKLKEKQRFLQTTMLSVYFLMLSLGIFLYMIEPVSQMSKGWAIFSYGLTLVWVCFNWFFIRPRNIRKQEQKINALIADYQALNAQLQKD